MATYLGSLVQLCCGEGGTLKTHMDGMCGECSQWMDHTGLPQPKVVHTAQAPGCSARALSQVDPVLHELPRSKRLRFLGALQGHRSR